MLPNQHEKRMLRRAVIIAVLIPAFALSLLIAALFVRSYLKSDDDGEDITSRLLSNPRFGEAIDINKLIGADITCIIPSNSRVLDFVRRHFPLKVTNLVRESDSDESDAGRWRIMAVWDGNQMVKIFDVWETGRNKIGTIELSPKDRDSYTEICSRNLLIKLELVDGRVTAFVQ